MVQEVTVAKALSDPEGRWTWRSDYHRPRTAADLARHGGHSRRPGREAAPDAASECRRRGTNRQRRSANQLGYVTSQGQCRAAVPSTTRRGGRAGNRLPHQAWELLVAQGYGPRGDRAQKVIDSRATIARMSGSIWAGAPGRQALQEAIAALDKAVTIATTATGEWFRWC